MDREQQGQLNSGLTSRGESLATFLSFQLGDFFGSPDTTVSVGQTHICDAGLTPPSMPTTGVLVKHHGTLTGSRSDAFVLCWFFGDELHNAMAKSTGPTKAGLERLPELATALADILATDKYAINESAGCKSHDMWNDYLAGALPPPTAWIEFKVEGVGPSPAPMLLVLPVYAAEHMLGLPVTCPSAASSEPAAATESLPTTQATGTVGSAPPKAAQAKPAQTATTSAEPRLRPAGAESPMMTKLLQTKVELIVTLCSQDLPAQKLLSLRPGSIIEFERNCNAPLILSVNNLPIGTGEAIKTGDHFGLKIAQIASPPERAARLGPKWKF
jgi:flagellar motor switch/type III secretory pathway protein FliN